MKFTPENTTSSVSRRSFVRGAGLSLGAVALPGLAAACTNSAPGPEKPKGIEDVPQVTLGPEVEGIPYPDPYVGPRASEKTPFHDGSKTFKVVVAQDAQVVGDWNDNRMTEWFEKRTGVKVEFQGVLTTGSDGSSDMTKINAMLASGELPDAFMGINFTNDQISLYGQQGVLTPLDDYIETYAPEMRRLFDDYPDWRSLVSATDGKVYQMGGINDCYHCKVGPGRAFINEKYIEDVGGAMPTTTEELRELLKLFKAKDPSGTGNMIPFTGTTTQVLDTYVMNSFLYNPGEPWLALDDGKVTFVADKPEWREALRFLHQLFEDGSITGEAFTMADEALLRAGNQGRLGVARAYWWGPFIDVKLEPDAPWRDYVGLPPLKGPGGVQYSRWDHYGYSGSKMVITSACKDPGVMVQWADTQMELEAILFANGGIQGKNWDWAKEGDTSLTGGQALFDRLTWPPPPKTSWNQHSVMYRSVDYRHAQYSDHSNPGHEQRLYEVTLDYEKVAQPKEMQLPPLIFDADAAAQRADIMATVANHVKGSMAKFAIGELDIDDDGTWDEYVSTLQSMGIPSLLKVTQKAYDERP